MLNQGTEEFTCTHCGAINDVDYSDYPQNDKGSVNCAACGEVLIEWRSKRLPHSQVGGW